ncbi:Adenylyltransferase and sulfurtransferase MOCS3 [Hondaea fermentalgiana]|uniref:Adenylyltransferase and sulfurtransferase MOCS3 n=1 Tax=Hondaea fermentalgiana TaxID=2315210 RepID=A0A2R5GVI5_9STRA|nr:Adenylyltransferase and sulfurtransferase MOCS3 [Hondaea fermentalgiana]|eukprot:GBG34339.1 Adenylyltransferase and sulfurtransferase MOCS3 [Hondaea fermentalgiana]
MQILRQFRACEPSITEARQGEEKTKKKQIASAAPWLRETSDAGLSHEDLARFARQLAVPGFGAHAQARVRDAKVLVVGAGGLGSPVIGLLAAAGVGRLGVVDGDDVELSNLHRQLLHSEAEVGARKAESAARAVKRINSGVKVDVYPFYLSARNVMQLVAEVDLVIEATDSLASKYFVNDACRFAGKPVILAAAQGVEGQVALYAPHGPCYRCMFPQPPPRSHRTTCQEDGVLGPVPYMVGSLQALLALQYLGADPATRQEVFGKFLHMFDGAPEHLGMRRVKLPENRRKICALCSPTAPTIQSLRDSASFANDFELFATCNVVTAGAVPGEGKVATLSWDKLQGLDPKRVLLVDVREARFREMLRFEGSHNIFVDALVADKGEQARILECVRKQVATCGGRRVDVVAFCNRGNDSKIAARFLDTFLKEENCSVAHVPGGMASYLD